ELEDPSFDLEAIENEVEGSIARAVAMAKPAMPPPVPRNKKLLPQDIETGAKTGIEAGTETGTDASSHPSEFTAISSAVASALAIAPTAAHTSATHTSATHKATGAIGATQNEAHTTYSALPRLALQQPTEPNPTQPTENEDIVPTGYLTSSEKLIESLTELPPLPEPVDTIGKPKRKTVSLLAGATLGFFGLTAGLSASYLMANPAVTQQLANRFKNQPDLATVESARTFDPPGPDLSANEFIDLEIDNLSSLKMPQVAIIPGEALPTPATATLESGLAPQQPPANLPTIQSATTTPAGLPAVPTAPATTAAIETQAVVVPVGLTYYVTAPVTTEQGLMTIRQTVGEAFVRRFADGNRIQIAAFDNPQAAQSLLAELNDNNIAAQIYGPTTE
ncbi:MAG: hypothetical protein AAFZ17_17625, partial [Cyanobacteria bacterium J06650_10]